MGGDRTPDTARRWRRGAATQSVAIPASRNLDPMLVPGLPATRRRGSDHAPAGEHRQRLPRVGREGPDAVEPAAHRIGRTMHKIDRMMLGEFDEVIEALVAEDEAARLAADAD